MWYNIIVRKTQETQCTNDWKLTFNAVLSASRGERKNKMKKYSLIDIYEGEKIHIGTFESPEDLIEAGEKWIKETDEECELIVIDFES